ncbi:Tip elongation aberrant protein Tea4 [Lachnellula suecica]|uniref:Tip elongation aberrant protein Tea4 n=1 Tax=Lachnellula suecica TaxID=602035 RepID=A0A8T9BZJ5_9HELO|nr:Tip elongation aberrant protein Tea4 [Lachnellula suecica]
MTRPEIIRADSIDLQDQNAPSAQDHLRIHPNPLGAGPPAPHQAETLREVAAEAAEQNHRSPRVSREWTNGEVSQIQQYGDDDLAAGVSSKLNGADLQQQDDLAVAQNGGMTGSTTEDADMADAEGDDGMDDDMMDKISSSPSIDDGGYSLLAVVWPERSASLASLTPTPPPTKSRSFLQACVESSSPFVETSSDFTLQPKPLLIDKGMTQGSLASNSHHLLGKYLDDPKDTRFSDVLQCADPFVTTRSSQESDQEFNLEYYTEDSHSRQSNSPNQDYNLDYISAERPENPSIRQKLSDDESDTGSVIHHDDGLTIPYEESEEDDDYEIPYLTDSRFIDSGWGGECLQNSEDIDFEFVYALHTFVATVEGQANATKGDTMVLLDDSNSYWWLVRVVKDSSIGYLPAEHIETPTERLARLNKHRNIDLTSTMLGDQAEKSKNPLKKAIRRRNAKTVTFTAPTYVEASDVDYSTDEEEGEGDYYAQNGQQEQNGDQQEHGADEDEITAVEPLKPRAEIREVKTDSDEPETIRADPTSNGTSDGRTSDEIFDGKPESKSRNGTVRNTDSFFKDDSVETRKITLTPNLLRDDSSTSTRTSNDSKELKQRPSLDKLEKDSTAEKNKDKKDKKEKKDREKKPGMLSGLFKRKEKKSKASIDDEVDEIMAGKRSTDNQSPVPSKESDEIASIEEQTQAPNQDMQRNPSKLQKQPRTEMSPIRKAGLGKDPRAMEPQQAPAPDRAPPAESVQAPSMRLVQSDAPEDSDQQARNLSPELTRGPAPILSAPKEQKPASAISKILRSASSSNSEPKPIKAKKAKARVELDDFDSSAEDSPVEEPTRAPSKQTSRPIPGAFPDSYIATPATERSNPVEERLSESPVQVSPMTPVQSYPPPLMVDTSSQEEAPSPQSSPSPELIDADDAQDKKGPGSSTASASTPSWSDSHLRTFFDDDADIKDLLVVVYDKSGVVPAGPDHPVTGNLFREENAKLADITNRLDGMLGDWLARKMRTQGSSR